MDRVVSGYKDENFYEREGEEEAEEEIGRKWTERRVKWNKEELGERRWN